MLWFGKGLSMSPKSLCFRRLVPCVAILRGGEIVKRWNLVGYDWVSGGFPSQGINVVFVVSSHVSGLL